ncbi:MAG: NAD-dependent epimerase/dehydratase family protein [Bacteroidota bacterium]
MTLSKFFPKRVKSEIALRVIADAIMINVAVAVSFVGRFLTFFVLKEQEVISPRLYASLFQESIVGFQRSAWLLTIISLIVFWMSGFYTYGRAYQSKYKLLVVFQAVSISFLLFVGLSYFVPFVTPLPRSMLLASWLLTLVLLIISRVWAYLWTRAIKDESKPVSERHPEPGNVLVIGGAGYIGSVLARQLLDRGYNVTVLDALIYGDEGIRSLHGTPRFNFIKGDLRDIEAVVGAMQGMDSVVHLGALVGDPACAIDEKLTLEINLAATRMISEVAKGYGVQRFIFASTCSVYGASEELLNEKSTLNPVSLYAKSKIASEEVILRLADDRFAPTILRFATIFGVSPRLRFDLVVNFLTARAIAEKSITIMGGQQWRPFIHVADAAESIVRVLEAPAIVVRGEIFNVGSDAENYQIGQVGELVKRAIPEVKVVTAGNDADRRNYRVSFRKFEGHVGFIPSRSVASGIAEIKQAIQQGQVGNYLSPKYSNHKSLAEEGAVVRIQRNDAWSSIYAAGVSNMLARPEAPARRSNKILVIDDDELHLALMQNILQGEGYETYTTPDGIGGIESYKEHAPNLVLLDLGLQGMQGIEVLKELRKIDPHAKIMIVTGHGALESAEAFRYGAMDYLRKPFDIPDFLGRIRNAVVGEARSLA